MPSFESLFRDARYGARMLRKSPVVTSAAILSLGLAIGACTAAFSLTYPSNNARNPIEESFSYPELERLRDAAAKNIELFTVGGARLRETKLEDAAQQIRVQFISGNAFDVLGVRPALGRLIATTDD